LLRQDFERQDALPVVQPTVSDHEVVGLNWRRYENPYKDANRFQLEACMGLGLAGIMHVPSGLRYVLAIWGKTVSLWAGISLRVFFHISW